MLKRMADKINKENYHPSKDAYLTNPVASASDFTGYGISMPMDDYEAENLSTMFENIPVTPSRLRAKKPKEKQLQNKERKNLP